MKLSPDAGVEFNMLSIIQQVLHPPAYPHKSVSALKDEGSTEQQANSQHGSSTCEIRAMVG